MRQTPPTQDRERPSGRARTSPGFNGREHDDADQKNDRHFVEPAIPDVAARVAAVPEVAEELAAPCVIRDEHHDENELRMEPCTGDPVAEPQAESTQDS